MTTNLNIDERGKMRPGIFFAVTTSSFLDRDMEKLVDDWFARDPTAIIQRRDDLKPKPADPYKTWFWFDDCSDYSECEQSFDCPKDSKHVTGSLYRKIEVDVLGGPLVSPISPDIGIWIIAAELKKQIEAAKLRGGDLRRVEINVNQTGAPVPEFYVWQFRGRDIRRPPIVTGGKNLCPFCGDAPAFCSGCGHLFTECPKCKKLAFRRDGDKQADERAIQYDHSNLMKRAVLEGRHWDGADLIYSAYNNFVTKRVLDLLLKVHAAPFVAWPVRICTDGMNDEQKKWLDEAVMAF